MNVFCLKIQVNLKKIEEKKLMTKMKNSEINDK